MVFLSLVGVLPLLRAVEGGNGGEATGGGQERQDGRGGAELSPEVVEQGQRALIDGAWASVEAANTRLMPPARWGKENKKALREWSERERIRLLAVADQARRFVELYGSDRRATQAMLREFEALSSLSRLVPDERERLEKLSEALLQRRDLERGDRYGVRLQQVFRQAKSREELEAGARSLLKEFGDGEAYEVLLLAAGGTDAARGKALCEEILRSGASPRIKERARGLLSRLEAEGQPFEMEFTALDGRAVNLKELRGKVVVIDFWATWCTPCVEALPELKAVYDKWHKAGLEVIGVSLDSDAAQLQQFVKEHRLPWPIFFDGKGWNNLFANRYGVQSIPMVWLIDKGGVLRSVNARGGLQAQVEGLLKEGMDEEQMAAAGLERKPEPVAEAPGR